MSLNIRSLLSMSDTLFVYRAHTIMEEAGVRYVIPIKRCDNADDLERVIFDIVEWIAQICSAGHEVH